MRPDGVRQTAGHPAVGLRFTGGAALLVLAACNTPLGTEVTRAAAKATVNPIVASRFPGLPVQPATDCVIDNATGDELVTLASAAATRDDPTATRIVVDVAGRPETIRCFGQDALPAILNTL
ncbi:hypothetical protein JANAI62_17360 [Jannaschia pagri]|uniref:Succinate dehydrogenase n=1 Tax=Jannaschia pagri TaxID=2829797 RepID=A0ABQ4NL20_9RHOB|nr:MULTISPECIES: hypothetical protein [unclassified Jannaschia]GIT91280.1 hypothetical protein JANAI61_17380 [Jannaschia sp. AI_61]GIT95113.1 hypothetical protein JANAI62_17360 [Jannaschia sp. AI_62]